MIIGSSPTRPPKVRVTVVSGGHEAAVLAARIARGLTLCSDPEHVGVVAEIRPPKHDASVQWLTAAAVEGERTEGCPCCRSRLDVVSSIRLLIERPAPVDRVIVLVNADRDISTVTQTILSDPDMQRLVELDGVIVTVDAVAIATRLAVEMPFAASLELQRLAIADRILVARADEVTDEALGRVMRSVRTINRFGVIAAPAVMPVDVGALVDLHAWHGAPKVGPAHGTESLLIAPEDDLPMTVRCEVESLLDPDAIDEWFDRLIAQYGVRLLRLQGAVAVVGEEHRVCCHGVRSYAASHSESEHLPHQRSTHSVVVVVGFQLDAQSIHSSFLAAVVD